MRREMIEVKKSDRQSVNKPLLVHRARKWMRGIGMGAGAVIAGAVVSLVITSAAHADDITVPTVPVPPADDSAAAEQSAYAQAELLTGTHSASGLDSLQSTAVSDVVDADKIVNSDTTVNTVATLVSDEAQLTSVNSAIDAGLAWGLSKFNPQADLADANGFNVIATQVQIEDDFSNFYHNFASLASSLANTYGLLGPIESALQRQDVVSTYVIDLGQPDLLGESANPGVPDASYDLLRADDLLYNATSWLCDLTWLDNI